MDFTDTKVTGAATDRSIDSPYPTNSHEANLEIDRWNAIDSKVFTVRNN